MIDLREGSHTAALLPPGSMISEGTTVLDKLEQQATMIAEESGRLMKRANQIVDNLAAVTDPKRFEGIDDIIATSRTMARNLEGTSAMLDTMVTENRAVLTSSLANVDAATKSIEAATRSAATMMDVQVAGLMSKAGELLAGLDNMVRSNEGHLRSSVFDLRQASRNFKELSRDLRQKPSRLLFSNTPGERKLP